MTRFGKWMMGTLLVAVALFVAALLVPVDRGAVRLEQVVPQQRPGPGDARVDTAEVTPSGLLIPVVNAPSTALVDSFGDPRGDTRRHGALDISAPRGTPVVAAAAGTVEKIFVSEAGGRTVYLRSPDRRLIYYYAHLDRYAPHLAEGEYLAQGQRIGFVGSTGDADPSAPHLHFEIKRMAPGEAWHRGTAIDPYPLLAGKAAAR